MILSTPEQNLSSLHPTRDILSKVSQYFRQLNYDAQNSIGVSEELLQLAHSKNKSMSDLLTQSIPFCEKTEELIFLSNKIKNNPFKLDLANAIRATHLISEIIDDYWDIIPQTSQNEIRESLEIINVKTRRQSASIILKNSFILISNAFFALFQNKAKAVEMNYSIFKLSDSIKFRIGLTDFIFPGNKLVRDLYRKLNHKRFHSRHSLRSLVRDVALEYKLGKSPKEIADSSSMSLDSVYSMLFWYSMFREETDLSIVSLKKKYDLLNSDLKAELGDCKEVKGFDALRVGDNIKEQLQVNQAAMSLLKTWIDKDRVNSTEVELTDNELDDFQKIIDASRPVGRKVFS